jgi:hypothetical protein
VQLEAEASNLRAAVAAAQTEAKGLTSDLVVAQVRMISALRFSQRLQLPYNVYNTL